QRQRKQRRTGTAGVQGAAAAVAAGATGETFSASTTLDRVKLEEHGAGYLDGGAGSIQTAAEGVATVAALTAGASAAAPACEEWPAPAGRVTFHPQEAGFGQRSVNHTQTAAARVPPAVA